MGKGSSKLSGNSAAAAAPVMTKENWKELLPENTTTAQKNAIGYVLRDIEKDNSYGGKDMEITRLEIERAVDDQRNAEMVALGMPYEYTLRVFIDLQRKDRNEKPYLNMLDEKGISFLVGKNGGYYEHTNNGKRKSLRYSDIAFHRNIYK